MTRLLLLSLLILAACAGPAARDEAVVYTSVDQVFSDPVFRACEERLGTTVRAVFDTEETKSTGILNGCGSFVTDARGPGWQARETAAQSDSRVS